MCKKCVKNVQKKYLNMCYSQKCVKKDEKRTELDNKKLGAFFTLKFVTKDHLRSGQGEKCIL